MTKLRIDIVSDVVCPWCIIGYKRLEQALSELEEQPETEIHWHPFELNPHMAPEGENLRAHLQAKYGTTLEGSIAARKRLTEMGAALGFVFDYADDMRMYNTFQAHQLLHWAGEQGKQTALKLALFATFFSQRLDVSDRDVLVNVAESVGLQRDAAREVLDSERFATEVRRQEQQWLSKGIQAVPAFIFNQRYLISGGQEVAVFKAQIRKLLSE